MFVGIGFVTVPLAIVIYTRINAKREAQLAAIGGKMNLTVKEVHELGDRAPDFRYSL